MGLTVGFTKYKLYTSCTAKVFKHDGVREKLRGLDYGDSRSKRRVVHSVPYRTIRANRIPKPELSDNARKSKEEIGLTIQVISIVSTV
jgi:hypothetical protein